MHAVDSGEPGRPTVLLLHAVGLDLTWWEPLAPRIREAGYRVIAADLPGHGDSPPLPGPPDLARLAEAVAALLAEGIR